jgi:hypothetical protein
MLDGALDGLFVGWIDGAFEGALEVTADGILGGIEGILVGPFEGELVWGMCVPIDEKYDGKFVGWFDGDTVGALEGALDGALEGALEGDSVGAKENSIWHIKSDKVLTMRLFWIVSDVVGLPSVSAYQLHWSKLPYNISTEDKSTAGDKIVCLTAYVEMPWNERPSVSHAVKLGVVKPQ